METKLSTLKKFNDTLISTAFPYSITCNYHGINLQFKTLSLRFVESLADSIPKNWISGPTNEKIIYLMTPQDFAINSQLWSEEISQDCFSFENNNISVQRDFACQIRDNKALLICDDCVGDGLYNFLRWYISEQLINLNKYVVHASCVLDKEMNAHLFLGHSGAGKTTITRLCGTRLVLGDDMNIISSVNNQLVVEAGAIGGQFNSMIGYDKKMPVKACYWLKQSQENRLSDLGPTEANQKLVASFANLHWPTLSNEKIEQLMNFSMEAASSVKFYDLHFLNSNSIWELLDP
ncbi:MAG: hypothetical protein WC635_04925 [Bacteriovorax sp.]